MWNLRSSVNGLGDRHFCSGHLGATSRHHLVSSIKVVHERRYLFEARKSLLFFGFQILCDFSTDTIVSTAICEAKTYIFECCYDEDLSYP